MSDHALGASFQVKQKTVPTFCFVGVSTGKSSIMKVFPRWMEALGRANVVMEGVDHTLHDSPAAYRQTVAQMKFDELSLGALVTSHKIDVLSAARDMFDYLDLNAQITGEISCISKRDGRLEGRALDPLTAGLSLDAVIGEDYFGRNGGSVLCFGAGGSGLAIALHLIRKEKPADRPARFVMVNRSQPRLDNLRGMVENQETDIEFEYICNTDGGRNDDIMEGLPDASVVINATGMGKDRPGSPVTDAGRFPYRGVAWEINYRGELDFWHQAKAQEQSRSLVVEDGWLYFLHGWTQVISHVLHVDMETGTFDRLAMLAEELRPALIAIPRSAP